MRLYLSSFRIGNAPEELIKLCSGNRAAVISNATDFKTPDDRAESVDLEISNLKKLGFEPKEVDLRKYFGKSQELAETIKDFDLIWVRGGNVFVLNQAFQKSGFGSILKQLLQEDKVAYGAYSAGIDVLSPSLHGIELVDPTDVVPEGYEAEIAWDGLGLLHYAVAPHYKSNHPESADVDKLVDYYIQNNINHKTLRDGEVILINGTDERIVGHPDQA
jgi:dipeptidase E